MGDVHSRCSMPHAWSTRYVSTLMRLTILPLFQPVPSPATPLARSGVSFGPPLGCIFLDHVRASLDLSIGFKGSSSSSSTPLEVPSSPCAFPPALALPEIFSDFSKM